MSGIKGRAYTAAQKKAIVDRLLKVWIELPEMRLGQLLDNATGHRRKVASLFYVEDENLLVALEEFEVFVKENTRKKV